MTKVKIITVLITILILALDAQAGEKQGNCTAKDIDCHRELLELAVSTNSVELIESVIIEINSLQDTPWKKHALGLLYLLKKDPESLVLSEKLLLEALDENVISSAQNLAELYFYKDNYTNSIKYLKLVEKQGYEPPSKNYVNWARLYAQNIYMTSTNNDDYLKALRLFNEIKNIDDSGVSFYFIGYHEFINNNLKRGLNYLESSAKKNNLIALMLLGDIYFTGEKIQKNLTKAKQYYLKAAEHNSDRAHYNLAVIYKHEGNAKGMRQHLSKAARLGNESAIEIYNKLVIKKN